MRGIQDVVHEHDYSIVTFFHGDTVDDEAIHLQRCVDRKVDGLILMPALDADGRTNAESIAALRRDGIPVVVTTHPVLAGGLEYYKAGSDAVEKLLAQPIRPSAIIAYDDVLALGIMKALAKRGIRVPEDIAIAVLISIGMLIYCCNKTG